MDIQILETVMNEMLVEQQQSTQSLKNLSATLTEQHLATQAAIARPIDTGPLQQTVTEGATTLHRQLEEEMTSLRRQITEGIGELGKSIQAQPKPIIRQLRFQFFPDTDRQGHYKLLINRICLVVILVMLLEVVSLLASQCIDRIHPLYDPSPSHNGNRQPAGVTGSSF